MTKKRTFKGEHKPLTRLEMQTIQAMVDAEKNGESLECVARTLSISVPAMIQRESRLRRKLTALGKRTPSLPIRAEEDRSEILSLLEDL